MVAICGHPQAIPLEMYQGLTNKELLWVGKWARRSDYLVSFWNMSQHSTAQHSTAQQSSYRSELHSGNKHFKNDETLIIVISPRNILVVWFLPIWFMAILIHITLHFYQGNHQNPGEGDHAWVCPTSSEWQKSEWCVSPQSLSPCCAQSNSSSNFYPSPCLLSTNPHVHTPTHIQAHTLMSESLEVYCASMPLFSETPVSRQRVHLTQKTGFYSVDAILRF